MTDYAGLFTQISLPVYSAMTDAQIVTALNAATVAQAVNVTGAAVRSYLLTTGEWGKIKALTLPGATAAPALIVVAINMVDTCEAGISFETALPTVLADITAGLGAFVSASLIAATTQTALLAMTTTTVSQASLLGFANGVSASDLAAARIVG